MNLVVTLALNDSCQMYSFCRIIPNPHQVSKVFSFSFLQVFELEMSFDICSWKMTSVNFAIFAFKKKKFQDFSLLSLHHLLIPLITPSSAYLVHDLAPLHYAFVRRSSHVGILHCVTVILHISFLTYTTQATAYSSISRR